MFSKRNHLGLSYAIFGWLGRRQGKICHCYLLALWGINLILWCHFIYQLCMHCELYEVEILGSSARSLNQFNGLKHICTSVNVFSFIFSVDSILCISTFSRGESIARQWHRIYSRSTT